MASTAVSSRAAVPLHLDEKWKLSKKEGSKSARSSASSSSSSSLSGNSSSRRRVSFAGKCARLVRQHRARFYIMRRCVTMLVCWSDH